MEIIVLSKEEQKKREKCQSDMYCFNPPVYKLKMAFFSAFVCKECAGEISQQLRDQVTKDTVVKIK